MANGNGERKRPDRETQRNEQAFARGGNGGDSDGGDPPLLLPELARRLMTKLMDDFADGELQKAGLPELNGKLTSDGAVVPVSPWNPDEKLGSSYALGVSRWLVGRSGTSEIQRLRIHLITKAQLRTGRSDDRYQALLVWLGERLHRYLEADQELRELIPATNEQALLSARQLSSWYACDPTAPLVLRGKMPNPPPYDLNLVVGDSVRHCTAAAFAIGTVGCFVVDEAGVEHAVSALHILSNMGRGEVGSDVLKVSKTGTMIIGQFRLPSDVTFRPGRRSTADVAAFAAPNAAGRRNTIRIGGKGRRRLSIVGAENPFDPNEALFDGALLAVGRDRRLFLCRPTGLDAIVSTIDADDQVYIQGDLIELGPAPELMEETRRKFSLPKRVSQENNLSKSGDSGGAVLKLVEAKGGLVKGNIVSTIVAGNERAGRSALSFAQPVLPFLESNGLKLTSS